jgi:hypothetical protein
MSRPSLRLATALVAILAAWPLLSARPEAHEIGTTRVTARFPTATRYEIEIRTDGQALIEKLEAVNGSPSSEASDGRFAELESVFRERVHVAFDDRAARPDVHATFAARENELSMPVITISLTGWIPADTSRLTWTYGWTFASYAFSVESDAGNAITQWLDGNQSSTPVPLDRALPHLSRLETFAQYLRLGFTHIVPGGLDHILFVLGLYLLSTTWRALLWQVSAFTLAHTISLGLAMNGLIAARPSVVEPLIAVSICYVAMENVVLGELKPWRVGLVFAFGLLHGLGFAGVLSELGLPRREFATALVAFNVGVETGQLFVIAAAVAAIGWWRSASFYRHRIVIPASLAIAVVAMYWTVQRLGY